MKVLDVEWSHDGRVCAAGCHANAVGIVVHSTNPAYRGVSLLFPLRHMVLPFPLISLEAAGTAVQVITMSIATVAFISSFPHLLAGEHSIRSWKDSM